MDIRVGGENAEQKAEECTRMIFAEDYRRGGCRTLPPVLEQILKDWPAHPDDVISVGLAAPPLSPVEGFKIERMHRCAVIANGKFVGYALRMSDQDISTLDGYVAAWDAHRRMQGH